jgi:hypothetical protein
MEADESGQNDRHESYFPWSWLQYHSHNCGSQKHSESPRLVVVEHWKGSLQTKCVVKARNCGERESARTPQ